VTDDKKADDLTLVVHRVRRAQGQLGGVLKMIEEGRELAEIVSQVKAVTRALDKAAFALLVGELRREAGEGGSPDRLAELEKVFLSLS
jgi:DNA-binding FrmR family transcriptional regulator